MTPSEFRTNQLHARVVAALRDELAFLAGALFIFRMIRVGTLRPDALGDAYDAIIRDLERDVTREEEVSEAVHGRPGSRRPDVNRVIAALRALQKNDPELAARELLARYGRGGQPVETFLHYPNFQ